MIRVKFDGEERKLYSQYEKANQVDYRYVIMEAGARASKEVSHSWMERHIKRCIRMNAASSIRVIEKVADTDLHEDGVYRPRRI